MFSFNQRPVFFAVASLAALSAIASGCAKKVSPAVGTWTGKTPLGSSATLTLVPDGTGTVSIPPIMQNKPITWKEGEDKKIELSLAPAAPSGGSSAAAPGGGGNFALSAFLGDDQKTMTLAFPAFSLTLNKAADAAAK